jgi:hypothetical protein
MLVEFPDEREGTALSSGLHRHVFFVSCLFGVRKNMNKVWWGRYLYMILERCSNIDEKV